MKNAAAVALVAIAIGIGAAPSVSFSVAVLRRDGLLIPFASFDGRQWHSDWPLPGRGITVPLSMSVVPSKWWGPAGPSDTWQAWIGSKPPIDVHVKNPVQYSAQCLQNVALRTDYVSHEPPPGELYAFPKDGLAISPAHAVEPIERVDVEPAGSVPRDVADDFNIQEAIAVHDADQSGERWRGVKDRTSAPLKLEAAYAAGAPTERVRYFEVSRELLKESGDCAGYTYGVGWFVERPDGSLRRLVFDMAITTCDRAGLLRTQPLGLVRSGERRFWIAQWAGTPGESYDIVEILRDRANTVIHSFGGGCQR